MYYKCIGQNPYPYNTDYIISYIGRESKNDIPTSSE